MPAISIVIPAYNAEPYLADCLESVLSQSFADIEVIIVDDCSKDNTIDIAHEFEHKDKRVRLIRHETNEGTLRARKTGTLASSGSYVLYLDPDDSYVDGCFARLMEEQKRSPAQILHFGVAINATDDVPVSTAEGMSSFMNPSTRELTGADILATAFSDDGFDWNVAHKMFDGTLMREAMSRVEDVRLTRSEDAYAFFVAAALAESYRSIGDSPWYIYNLGRGLTKDSAISLRDFTDIARQNILAYGCIARFAKNRKESTNDAGYQSALDIAQRDVANKLLDHTCNEWQDHLVSSEKIPAIALLKKDWDNTALASELYRFLRDKAYAFLQQARQEEDMSSESLHQEIDILQKAIAHLQIDITSPYYPKYDAMKGTALNHLEEAEGIEKMHRWEKSPIRLFVTSHKPVDMPEGDIIQMVQVGNGLKNGRFPFTYHDDDGENISEKNPMYCELTTQYWAWKNIDAEYYGFCHYRRYFDFSDIEHEENDYGEIIDDYIDDAAIKEYKLDDSSITKTVRGYDIITTGIKDLREVIDGHGTPKKLYAAAPYLKFKDLRHVYDILCVMHPDYKQDADAFLDGNFSCFCNMYIMRKEQFFAYCEWMFPLLEKFEKTTDMSLYSKEALRTPGHLSERLFNIWLMHQKRVNSGLKTKELQCVHFTDPDKSYSEQPVNMEGTSFERTDIVPVVFAADNNYVAQLTTTIYSAMKNASADRYYDVTVLQKDIAWVNQESMRKFFARFKNMNLRFVNVNREIAGYKLDTNNEHISIETYYRFLIQQVLPFYGKVLYLDADLVVNGDISELYDTELGDNLLAACHDVDYLGNLNINDGIRMKYTRQVLGMKDPYSYFQAGVLVLNTKAMREHYTIQQWLEYASNPEFIYNDQDVLNAHCEGKVTYLDWEWNVVHDCAGRVANVFSFAPNYAYDAYIASRANPRIIHYAGFEKPWKKPDCDFADVYWDYARETPFYERLLKQIAGEKTVTVIHEVPKPMHERAVGEDSGLRKFVDPVAPIGTARREVLKSLMRMARGRQ
ncbi:glycosyltransferase [Bifidobacterium primatium]|uniref:Glycosyltransferase n=1 Tax=Bifidobacterium primatium TaxID=2045438 RepID=A0A2M9HB85_9BIFI|nr:DUF4422 domain-containing protein [Bifidobacterium primatium]PJM74070.1 glycosyltransferase [Bifidobacterium primatium]